MSGKAKGAKKATHSVDTLAFTESLGLQTFRKGQRKTWLKPDDEHLLHRLKELYPAEYAANTLNARGIDWDLVAESFRGERKAKDCRKRWALSLDPNLRRGKWTPAEDALLVQQFAKYGALWQQVALQIEGRTEHQCLKRYYEVLDPNVRNRLQPWTEAEDLLLIELVTRHGTKWKTIANELQGRPSLTCRNRWRNLVTAVVRGRASTVIVDKMAAKFDGNFERLAEGTLPPGLGPVKKEELEQGPTESDLADLSGTAYNNDVNDRALLAAPMAEQRPNLHGPTPLDRLVSPLPRPAPWQELMRTGFAEPTQTHSPAPPMATEWRYSLETNDHMPENDTLRSLVAHGGQISLEQLANALVLCAVQYNLQVNVHHHHHYALPARPSSVPANVQRAPNPDLHDLPGFAHLHQEILALPLYGTPDISSPGPRGFSLEPEAQLARFQHFNYLPPLTPVPKLQSLASSPDASSKGSTHYHHHHHYTPVHALRADSGAENGTETTARDLAKELDLFRLLNVAELKIDADAAGRPVRSAYATRDNLMTPLLQAVQMAAAADAVPPQYYKRPGEDLMLQAAKRRQNETPTLDFLNAQVGPPNSASSGENATRGDMDAPGGMNGFSGAQPVPQPVSQHHPLHYFTSSTSVNPEDMVDEEDEDYLSSWGMYSMRDKPQEPLEISEESLAWFPFNPS
ncbi:Myb-like DNA-binding protein BAS1 [Metschnikowia aff. pulcherrima]|uniref:Myb-like DNA-binding protein BAS1 n=1 Tax=Metschnikowia aff. pulcherrima TaxID=2163413 RepID=A0A4P6XMR0_9ASCO|nr:Myb-like DNA-binding protein BAS1 [Metschnikowia aff. pulcherrima]